MPKWLYAVGDRDSENPSKIDLYRASSQGKYTMFEAELHLSRSKTGARPEIMAFVDDFSPIIADFEANTTILLVAKPG